jgi:hypothetical protein
VSPAEAVELLVAEVERPMDTHRPYDVAGYLLGSLTGRSVRNQRINEYGSWFANNIADAWRPLGVKP